MKQTEKSALTQQRIIEVAISEIAVNGYNGMSLNVLCDTYGISKGHIYHHFADKDALYLACVKKCFDRLILMIDEMKDTMSGTVDEKLSQYFNARIHFFMREPLFMGIFAEAMFRSPVPLLTKIEEIRKPFDELNIGIIRKLLSEIPLRNGLNIETAVKDLNLYINAFNMQFQYALNSEVSVEQTMLEHEQSAKRQISILLYGMLGEMNLT